jgi:drug/metabolite transporter (DMT)-like permease
LKNPDQLSGASTASAPSAHNAIRNATLIGLTAIVFWSATVGLVRSIAEALGPAGGAASFFSVAAVLTCAVLGIPRLRHFSWRYLLIGGLLFVSYEVFLALSLGMAHSRAEAMELGMINYLWPCLTIVLAVLTGQQRSSMLLWPGAALSLLGIVWVLKGDSAWSPALLWDHMQGNPVAYLLAFSAAALWAAYSVFTRRYGGGKSAVPLFLLMTALVLWIKYGYSNEAPLHFSWSSAVQVLVLGGLSATAYSCWNVGIQHGNMTLLAAASYFTPIFSVLLASLWLQTQPSLSFWQGVVMVTLGSLICWRSTRR